MVHRVGGPDSLTALFVVLALAAAFHRRDHIRTAAHRALTELAGGAWIAQKSVPRTGNEDHDDPALQQ
jgi:MYXO-CTERM domain-containing protein